MDETRGAADDDVESRGAVREELRAVSDGDGNAGVVEDGGHMGEKLTREMHDSFVDAAKYNAFDALVLQDFAYHTHIPAANDEHVLRVRWNARASGRSSPDERTCRVQCIR